MQQLMIPEKIKVGYQERPDTYTKRLAYVIYYDQKGVLRKEKSWQTWRDQKIDSHDFDNVPTEGFVLNKKVGGYKSHWNYRDAHVRVYDPRNFEFEISVSNLLGILQECDCSRGKGLEGKFVYAWEGTELVLLPAASEDYKNSQNFTKLQTQKVKAKELILGASYQTKRQEVYTYLGRFTQHIVNGHNIWQKQQTGLQYVFWSGTNFVFLKDLKSIAVLNSDIVSTDYAFLVDKYNKSIWGSKPVKLFLGEKVDDDPQRHYYRQFDWGYQDPKGNFFGCSSNCKSGGYNPNTGRYESIRDDSQIRMNYEYFINEGVLHAQNINKIAYQDPEQHRKEQERDRHSHQNSWYYRSSAAQPYVSPFVDYIVPTNFDVWVELESGMKFPVKNGGILESYNKQENYDGNEENDN